MQRPRAFLAVLAVITVLSAACSAHELDDHLRVTTRAPARHHRQNHTHERATAMNALHHQQRLLFERWMTTQTRRAWFAAVAQERGAVGASPAGKGRVHEVAPTATAPDGHPCGGDLPPCYVMQRESGGNPNAYASSGCHGPCYGKWQFDARTWIAVSAQHPELNLPADPTAATETQQDAAARALWANGAGCSHWSAC